MKVSASPHVRWAPPHQQSSWPSTGKEPGFCRGSPHRIHVVVLQSSLWPLRQKTSQKILDPENGRTWSLLGTVCACARCTPSVSDSRPPPPRPLAAAPPLVLPLGKASHLFTTEPKGSRAASSEGGWFLHGQMSARSCCWRHCWLRWLYIHGLYLERATLVLVQPGGWVSLADGTQSTGVLQKPSLLFAMVLIHGAAYIAVRKALPHHPHLPCLASTSSLVHKLEADVINGQSRCCSRESFGRRKWPCLLWSSQLFRAS